MTFTTVKHFLFVWPYFRKTTTWDIFTRVYFQELSHLVIIIDNISYRFFVMKFEYLAVYGDLQIIIKFWHIDSKHRGKII